MSRPVTTLLFFFLFFNLFAATLMSTGVAATIGIETNIGGGDEVDESLDKANGTIETGAPTGSTLFGMYNVLADGINTIVGTVTAGHTMLAQAGVPGAITGMLNSLFAIVIVIDIISFMRGWGL